MTYWPKPTQQWAKITLFSHLSSCRSLEISFLITQSVNITNKPNNTVASASISNIKTLALLLSFAITDGGISDKPSLDKIFRTFLIYCSVFSRHFGKHHNKQQTYDYFSPKAVQLTLNPTYNISKGNIYYCINIKYQYKSVVNSWSVATEFICCWDGFLEFIFIVNKMSFLTIYLTEKQIIC